MGRNKGGGESRGKWQTNNWRKEIPDAITEVRRMNSASASKRMASERRPKVGNYGSVLREILTDTSPHSTTHIQTTPQQDKVMILDQLHRKSQRIYKLKLISSYKIYDSNLVYICLNSISKHFEKFDFDYLQYAISSIYPPVYKLLSTLCCEAGTMTDSVLKLLGEMGADVLVIGEKVTERGMQHALQHHNGRIEELRVDSWEDIDLEQDLPFSCSSSYNLRELVLINSNVGLSALLGLLQYTTCLEKLVLHNIKISIRSSLCASLVLSYLLHKLKNIQVIEISYCDWMTFDVLAAWFSTIMKTNVNDLSLSMIRIVGLAVASSEQVAHIENAQLFFKAKRNIESVVTYSNYS